jgi:ABC-type nitrate/sulfonate/bicarbonate transport system permease component
MAGLDRAAAFGASPPRLKTPLIYLRARVLDAVPFLMIALVLAGWEAVAHSRLVTPFMLPAIETVARQIAADVPRAASRSTSPPRSIARWWASVSQRWRAWRSAC